MQIRDNQQEAIREILQRHQIKPLYTYAKNRHEIHRNFIIKWTFYYNTPALLHGEKVFLKILLDKNRHDDFLSQIRFHRYLEEQSWRFFSVPKLLYHATFPTPYAIFSFAEGKLLGSLASTKSIFSTDTIIMMLQKGIQEIQTNSTTIGMWKRVKDFPWFNKLLDDLKIRLQENSGGKYLSDDEIWEVGELLKKFAFSFSLPSVALFGDLSPSNIIMNKNRMWIFDQAPFTLGNPYADMAEFLSYGLMNKSWQIHTQLLSKKYKNKPLWYINLLLFITNRIVNECELMKLFGQRERYLHNIAALKLQKLQYQKLLRENL